MVITKIISAMAKPLLVLGMLMPSRAAMTSSCSCGVSGDVDALLSHAFLLEESLAEQNHELVQAR